jgi:hypothetical protein
MQLSVMPREKKKILYSTKLQILYKFIYGKIDATVRTTWIPVRMRFSLRRESQFKFNRPNASLLSSRHQSAIVQTRVHLIWKLRIQLQPSGHLPIIVRTRVPQIWKLRVKDQPSGRPSPLVRKRKNLIWKLLARTCDRPGDSVSPSGRGSQTGKIFSENRKNSGRTVVCPHGSGSPSGRRPYILL